MSKRPAETQLTPEDLLASLNEEGKAPDQAENSKASEAELQGRKIIKVKRHFKND